MDTRGFPAAGVRPRFPEQRDLFGLQLIERHLRILEQER